MEIEHFINPGVGWECKHCRAKLEARAGPIEGRARFFSEGESESKEPVFSTLALARWRDRSRQILVCPRCSIEERVNKT